MVEDKVALVTGGAKGIGEACCYALAELGFKIAACDIDLKGVQSTVAHLPTKGNIALGVDLRNADEIEPLFAKVESDLGEVTALICVAGGAIFREKGARPDVRRTSLEDWDTTFALNSRSTFLAVQRFLRRREKMPVESGRIVLISSAAAFYGRSPTGPAYAASKGALQAFMRSAAVEAGPLGITVNAVAPGPIATSALMGSLTNEQKADLAAVSLLGRLGEPWEVAAGVAFLASERAGFITGSTLHINGGTLMV